MSDQAASRKHLYPNDSHFVTVLAPTPQDARYCDEILREHGVPVEFLNSVIDVITRIRQGAGVVLIAQEFLTAEARVHLRCAIDDQPSWSDVPILVLLAQYENSTHVIADLLSLGHVTLIERPLRIGLLVSTLKAKLRDRARQYEVRDLLLAAQQASESKSAFVANMSHEIRTPMTSILGYAELMSGLVEDEEALGYLSTIRRNGNFLLDIIDDILDLSKIEAGKLDIDVGRFDPVRVIEDVRSIMELRASEKGLDLDVIYPGQIPQFIESDAKRLKQILINLVGNAIKFTRKGSVKVELRYSENPPAPAPAKHLNGESSSAGRTPETARSSRTTSQNGNPSRNGQMQFVISDTGIGITRTQQSRLFRPFSQGDSSVNREFGGTGLGLAISTRLAAMLGGSIDVDSQPDEGSTFTLSIDTGEIADVKMVHPPADARKIMSQPGPAGDIHLDCRILVVDDRRDVRFLSKHILTQAGAIVEEAEDGQLALDAVALAARRGEPYDLILLDMQMPNLDGYETVRALRRMDFSRPVIALTADAMQGDMARCLECGCNDYLSKPIDQRELLQKIRLYVDEV